jgi:hypothetical protein
MSARDDRKDRDDKKAQPPRDSGNPADPNPPDANPSDALPDDALPPPDDVNVGPTTEPSELDDTGDVPEAVSDVLLGGSDALDVPEEDISPEDVTDEDLPQDVEVFPATETLPVFDADGNVPSDLGTLDRALAHWESVAALVPDDPRFLPRPTTKRRRALIRIDRGPRLPIVWMDREASRLVLYREGQDDEPEHPDLIAGILAGRPSVSERALLSPTSDGGPPLARPIVIVRLLDEQTRKVVRDALAVAAVRDKQTASQIAEQMVNHAFWLRDAQERAIYGDY